MLSNHHHISVSYVMSLLSLITVSAVAYKYAIMQQVIGCRENRIPRHDFLCGGHVL